MAKKFAGLKPLTWFLLAVLVFLQYELFFQSGGAFSALRIHEQLKKQEAANAALDQQNQVLMNQVALLQTDNRSLEGVAREELGMVKKGEIYYRFVQ